MRVRFSISIISIGIVMLFAVLLAYVGVAEHKQTKDELVENFPAEASELRSLKEKWITAIQTQGAQSAYEAFLQEAPLSDLSTHAQAHAIGEALYVTEGMDGLRVCDSSFEFGCYHSFFGVAVHEEGIGALPLFDEACKTAYGNEDLPCQHGIGHGILVYTDYSELQQALELCETISRLPTGGCSSGVFMEYNFHTMDESANGSYVRELNENPYKPCDSLPDRFKASCYFEQVQWWQNIYGGDFTYIGELCSVLPPGSDVYNACYNGIGNYVAAHEQFSLDNIIMTCATMPNERSRGLCHEGASWLVRAEPGKEETAQALCEALEEPYQSQCFQKLQL